MKLTGGLGAFTVVVYTALVVPSWAVTVRVLPETIGSERLESSHVW